MGPRPDIKDGGTMIPDLTRRKIFRAVPAVCLKPAIPLVDQLTDTPRGEMMVDTHRGEMMLKLCATTAAVVQLALLCSHGCGF